MASSSGHRSSIRNADGSPAAYLGARDSRRSHHGQRSSPRRDERPYQTEEKSFFAMDSDDERRNRHSSHHQQSQSRPVSTHRASYQHDNSRESRSTRSDRGRGQSHSRDERRSKRRRSRDHGEPRAERKRSRDDRETRDRRKSKSRDRRKSKSRERRKSKSRHLKKKASNARLNRGRLADKYTIKEKLGKGNFAVVRRVVSKESGEGRAAKIISKKQLTDDEKSEIQSEVVLLKKLIHPNVVRLIEVIDTPRHLYLVMELLLGGELFDRIIQNGHFSEKSAALITGQLGDALNYLHSQFIVHRDLKPENIIYATKETDSPIKITDFGLAKRFGNPLTGEKHGMATTCGTPGYVAPEILRQIEYDQAVDLWSCGVILYIMLCGFPPFSGNGNVKKMYKKIKRGDYSFPSPQWDGISKMAKDCVRCLLTVDPRSRMTGKQLCEHPWVKGAHLQNAQNIMTNEFSTNLKNYTHKKRLRRGVDLVITLNRMIRAAGLEEQAKLQRVEFRLKLDKVKRRLRKQQDAKKMAIKRGDKETIAKYSHLRTYSRDGTPPIDYDVIAKEILSD